MASIRIKGLVKRFGNRRGDRAGIVVAVDHIDVHIADGSLTAVLGPSGCGKTTLLRCIAGLTMPDEGRIFIDDVDVTDLPPFRRNLGMVFQRPSMFPHMTAYQNLAWALRLRGWPKDRIAERVQAMLALVNLEGMEDRTFNQLSGGQAQRVVIARSLAPEPDLLLLDEPLSSLDAKLRDRLKLEIAEIHRKTGCTTILVTHDQAEALTIADNVLLMHKGKIVQEGTPLDVYRNPQTLFSANFIGTNNLLPGVITEVGDEVIVKLTGSETCLKADRHPSDVRVGARVWACVRADDIDVLANGLVAIDRNVITVAVARSSMTGGIVIIEGQLEGQPLRIHVGGSHRFDFLDPSRPTITCELGNVSVIPREDDDTGLSVTTMDVDIQTKMEDKR